MARLKRGRKASKQDEADSESGESSSSKSFDTEAVAEVEADRANIYSLPDEILLKVFSHLSTVGAASDQPPWYHDEFPFHKLEWQPGLGAGGSWSGGVEGQRGLRAYPFLAQVCLRWKDVLESLPGKRLWKEVTVDFGHEIVTSIHCPLEWSNRRPTESEFRESFASTTLSADKILQFLEERKDHIFSLSLLNSEGYWSDDGDFVSLAHKHDFSSAHLGMVFGILRNNLQELTLQHCNDLLGPENTSLGVLGLLPNLKSLAIESLRCRVKGELLSGLSKLKKLESLSIAAEEQAGVWAVGLDALPEAWRHLTSLRRLSLRNSSLLESLPPFVCEFPHLTSLDVSFCRNLNLSFVDDLACPLRSLALQGLGLVEAPGGLLSALPHSRVVPRLQDLTSLTALSLADNRITRVPAVLEKLTLLSCVDLSGNYLLQVPRPLGLLSSLPHLRLVDLRGIHAETCITYWSESKCTTMRHLGTLAKNLKRRTFQTHVLMDTD